MSVSGQWWSGIGRLDALLDHAQAAQLVVVGTHGRGGFVGMLLGSVSRKVILGATCPVMIVPS